MSSRTNQNFRALIAFDRDTRSACRRLTGYVEPVRNPVRNNVVLHSLISFRTRTRQVCVAVGGVCVRRSSTYMRRAVSHRATSTQMAFDRHSFSQTGDFICNTTCVISKSMTRK